MIRDQQPEVEDNRPRLAETAGGPLQALRGSGLADRFCAWRGRGEQRVIFTVFSLQPGARLDDLPLAGGGVALGVRREAGGRRRILWAAAVPAGPEPDALAGAVAAVAAEGGEIHLHLLADGAAAREAIVAGLDCPRLALGRGAPGRQSAATPSTPSGASMNPPDWRCQRSA